jgi:methionine--tRNA ligase beta chain
MQTENNSNSKISIDDFKKVEITVGKIISAEKIDGADKLLKLSVDFGTETRQILSGIALHYEDPSLLIGKKFPFVTNLEPRTIRGLQSNGMILAVSDLEGGFALLEPNSDILQGSRLS